MNNQSHIQKVAFDLATILHQHGVAVYGCGCCGSLDWKGISFSTFTLTEEGVCEFSYTPPEKGSKLVKGSFSLTTGITVP